MKTPAEIIDAIGPEKMAEALGVSVQRIQHARHSAKLPSLWFDFCERATGCEMPRSVFTFK